jgi:hypothetical protein
MKTLVLVVTLAVTAAAHAGRMEVVVDPRVELMSLIFRLAGNPEYNMPNSASPYADEVDAHFGPFKEHAVVQTARRLRRERGVSYDAVMSLAVHVKDTTTLAERIPFDEPPPRLDARWTPEAARAFLDEARAFVRESDFNAFIADHQAFYEQAAARLQKPLDRRDYVDWFDGFFGERPKARFTVIVGLLNGGGNYGAGVRFPDGTEQIMPIIGAYRFDGTGLPVFGPDVDGTIVHELCHSYTNPCVDAFADELEPAGTAIFPHREAAMQRQAYGNWKTMMYESMVRACTVRFTLAHDGPAAAQQEIKYNEGRGFTWTGKLAGLLGQYERGRDEYPTLDAFMPRVVEFFNTVAEGIAAEDAAREELAPHVLSMIPPNGATDVDPDLTTITVVFDRPMSDGSWSVCGGGPDFPETTGPPSYDQDRRVFSLPVKLKPAWTYHFMLNSSQYTAFRSADGVPLEPVEVTFTTRAQ